MRISVGLLIVVIVSSGAGGQERGQPGGVTPERRQPAEGRPAGRSAPAQSHTTLGVEGTRFTINNRPTFLLGISYYGALGAPEDFLRRDLDDLQRFGFNWLRVWATCGLFEQDISVVDAAGHARQVQLATLKRLVSECDRRGLVVDVTMTRASKTPGWGLPNFQSHKRAVETIVRALKEHRNWYLDLANERDVGDERFVPANELKQLRATARRLDPARLVTASFGGHDLTEAEMRESLQTIALDFVAPHRPRGPESPAQTAAKTRECLGLIRAAGRSAPVHYQEPLRRGYETWNPSASDILADLRGAVSGGAAGWCFHNGPQRGTKDNLPRRSFDVRYKRLFDQLDPEELIVIQNAAQEVRRAGGATD